MRIKKIVRRVTVTLDEVETGLLADTIEARLTRLPREEAPVSYDKLLAMRNLLRGAIQ